mgnify:CR=1 FL=1
MVLEYNQIVKKIKDKRELAGLSDLIVKNVLEDYEKKYKISLISLKEKELKLAIKEIRASLRNYTGRFQKNLKLRKAVLKKGSFIDVLKTHSSTAERLDFYPQLNKIISDLNISSILDLACGLNPLAIAKKDFKYYASDIDESNLEIVKTFFQKNNIAGEVFTYDLRRIEDNLPKVDLCLLFKVLDIIDDKKHKLSEKILKVLQCKYLLVSFSTKKLSGKSMDFPQRYWFEKLITRLNYKYKIIKTKNEVFFLIEKVN